VKLHHVAIQVGDLDAARAFYEGVLGLVVTRTQAHATWVDAGGVIVMLERCRGAAAADAWASDAPGPFVVAFTIDAADRDMWRARLTQAGVTLSHESPFTLYFRDPWGTRLALSHYASPPLGA
jgi:catechol 2,3-dioxygenase-like lactoylglutathione lyase family enzyme